MAVSGVRLLSVQVWGLVHFRIHASCVFSCISAGSVKPFNATYKSKGDAWAQIADLVGKAFNSKPPSVNTCKSQVVKLVTEHISTVARPEAHTTGGGHLASLDDEIRQVVAALAHDYTAKTAADET